MSCAAMLTICLATAPQSVCLPQISRDLGMDHAQMGLFLSAPFWAFPLAIMVAGPLADRWGFKLLMVAGAVLQATGMLLISASSGQAGAWAGGFVVGLGCGIADTLLTPIVCAIYPQRRAGATMLLHAFYPLGLIVMVLAAVWMLHTGLPWRSVFAWCSLAVVPYVAAALLLPLPRQSHEGDVRMSTRRIIFQPRFVLLSLAIFLAGVTEIGPSQWLVKYVEESTAAGQTMAGAGLMFFGVTMATGRLSLSFLASKLGQRRLLAAGGALCALSLLMAAVPPEWLARFGFNPGPTWTIVWLTLVGLGVSGFWPLICSSAGDRYPQGGATMFSVLSAAGNCGGVAGPLAIGLIAESLSLPAAMACLTLAPVLLAVLTMAALRPGPRKAD